MQNFHKTSYLANIWFSKFTVQKSSQFDNLKSKASGEAAEITGNYKINSREGENDANSNSEEKEKGLDRMKTAMERTEMADRPLF